MASEEQRYSTRIQEMKWISFEMDLLIFNLKVITLVDIYMCFKHLHHTILFM